MEACVANPQLAPTLLMIEQLPAIVAEQVKAIQNLKIEKITVWDSGHNGNGKNGTTADFLAGLIGALPPLHELAEQAGIELPAALGRVQQSRGGPANESMESASGEDATAPPSPKRTR
jgi:flotillin